MNRLFSRQHNLKLKLLVTAVAAVTASAQAAEQADLPETETLVIVGQATGGLDSLITTEELEAYQATDLTDTFRRDPSVTAGGSIGMSQKIYLRNIGEDSLHISVDGAEQAAATFHHAGRIAIEPELLKQVEIEAGAGSATAGPGALGGSIRFVTKDPEDLLAAGKNAGALLKGGYYSNGDGWKNSATVFGRSDSGKVSGLLSMSKFEYDDMEDGNGDELAGTESDKGLVFAKIGVNLTDDQRLTLSHESLNEEGDINYRPEWEKSAPAPTEWKRKTTILNYGYSPENSDLLDLTFNLYHTESDSNRYYDHPVWAGTYGGIVETVGFTLKNSSQVGIHELIYGINYRDDKSSVYQAGSAPHQDENGEVKGLFLQDIITVNEQLTVAAGARFDKYELDDVNGLELSDSGFAPNISVNYEIQPGISVSAGYAEAIRGPEIRDSMKLESYNNNPDLEAERAKNLELGMNIDGDDYSVALGVYRSHIENAIINEGGIPWNKTYGNADDDIETLGYFARVEKSWNQLTLGASINIAETKVDDVIASRYVYGSSANSIGDTLAVTADYQATDSLKLGWSAEFVRGMKGDTITINDTIYGDTYTLDYKKPGYAVHDIYATWMPMADDQLTLTLSVSNLFDKQYLSHASLEDFTRNPDWENIVGSPSEGRDVRLSAALRF